MRGLIGLEPSPRLKWSSPFVLEADRAWWPAWTSNPAVPHKGTVGSIPTRFRQLFQSKGFLWHLKGEGAEGLKTPPPRRAGRAYM